MRRPPLLPLSTAFVCLVGSCAPAHLDIGGDGGVQALCGDGRVTGDEQCDDGDTMSGDGCSATCEPEIPPNCGDGILQKDEGEFCDDGNQDSGDGCGLGCWFEGCGNGFLDEGEACEDGDLDSGDGCSATCKSDETCGNGVVDEVNDELCDDGNDDDSDTCPASCKPASCGDGFVQRGVESCDGGEGCTNCILDSCGDGQMDAGEECDDGPANGTDGSTCMLTCLTATVGLESTYQELIDPGAGFSTPQWIELADFNNDGRLDAAMSSSISVRTSVAYGLGDGRFAPQRYVIGQSGSDGAVFADLNGDGRPDYALVSDSFDAVQVILDDGEGGHLLGGSFTTAIDTGGLNPFGIAAAELTGDGNIDLVTANTSSNDVTLLQGAGDGTFLATARFAIQSGAGGTSPRSIAVGDVTGDGVLDIVTANLGSSDVGVVAGLGNGTFAPVEIYSTVAGATGTGPLDLVLADVTNDGRLDVLTANGTSSDVAVLEQNGDGTLAPPQVFPTFSAEVGLSPQSLAVGDVNRDGVPDIVTANSSTSDVSVILGLGGGVSFGPPEVISLSVDLDVPSPRKIVIADVTDDYRPDLVVGCGDGTVRVLTGDAAGGLSFAGAYAVSRQTAARVVVDLAVHDVDGDDRADLMVATDSDGIVLSGTGDGRFMPPAMVVGGGLNAAIGQLDGDDRLDLLGPQSASTVVTRSLQPHHGRFLPSNFAITTAASTVGLGDFNGANSDDAICVSGATVFVFQNDGMGTFAPAMTPSVALATTGRGVAVGDISGDGDLDAVVTMPGLDQVALLFGNGALGFSVTPVSTAVATSGQSPVFAAIGDVDGVMGPDVITANSGSNDVSVLLATGSGTFAAAKVVAAEFGSDPAGVNMVRTGDLNGDGHLDLVTANFSRNTVSVILGFGNGNFARAQTYDVAAAPTGVAVGDVNGDRLDDVVVLGSANAELQVLLSGGHP